MAREKRFSIDEKNGVGMLTTTCVIIDNETGVNYLFVNAGGLTPLLDATVARIRRKIGPYAEHFVTKGEFGYTFQE